ncbi:hypothetical protein HW555_010774 [Spodoptera exigua]|uniref:Uncharacterized protein n=1 Tax=Spodoptera exigua TaxID=7107 RepID=A0A835L289_SPOEX|nr:hypothetical protein HW555_010774 [Spodoptera exigua]
MKASKDVYVTKRDIRLESNLLRDFEAYSQAAKEKDNLSLRNQQKSQEIGCQYDCRRENLKCTCKNQVALRKKEEVRNIELPKQVYAYHRSRSSTEIGVSSVKALQKKKVKKIYLPETDDRAVGSSDLSSYVLRKHRNRNKDISNKNKETTSKCVGGTVKYNISCVMNEKLSPIVLTISGVTKSNRNAEIGSNSIIKSLTNTTTQFEDVNKQELRTEEIVQPIISVQDDLEDRKTNRHNSHNNYECIKEKINNPAGKAFSSDSLVQRVHNLDNLNEGKVSQNTVVIAPIENKLEKDNKHVIDKSKSKDSKPADEKSITDLKSPSAFKRRFEAIRRSLAKREDLKKSATFTTEAGQVNATSHKDVSINSDPPSLEGRTDSNARTYSPFSQNYSGDKTIYNPEASRHRRSMSGSNHWSSQRIDNDSECQGVKGKFQLWGKKCDEEEDCKRRCTPRPSYTTTRKRFNKKEVPKTLKKSDTIKKESRKFFFFKRKDKSSNKVNPYKPMVRKGVTAGRCEVRDGLVIKICGGANTAKEASKPPESVEDHGEIFRNGWLKEFLSQTIEPRNSVQVRWNNKKYAPSSSTVVELMDSVYKDSGLVIRSKSQVSVQPSYKPHTKQHVSFVKQRIEAWMIPRTVTDRPQMIPLKQNANENKNNNIEVTISDQKWCIDKSKAFSHKIEVVLHTQNFNKLNNEESSEYLRIDIPKGFFVDSSSDDTNKNIVVNQSSDEEVYKIVEYETGSDLKREKTQRSFYTGDHHKQNNIKVTVSVKEVKDGALKQDPLVQRDVVIQGSNVNVPLKCDVVGVGIITQRDLRDIRKPILKIQDDYSDEESDRDVPNANKKCELAKRFLQEFCRDWTHLSNDSWRASDPHMRYCSATSFHNEGMKSSPNMFDEFQTSAIVSSCPTSECIHCTPHLQNLEQDKKSKKCKWFKRKKKKEQKNKDESFQRTRPKDSIEVCKRRRVHALLKSKWVCPYSDHDRPYSLVTSNESRANQHLPTTECPKLMKSCCKTVDPRPRRRKCKKHVSLPDCDTMNDLLARHLNGPEGILAFKGAGGCELCKRKVCPKHTTINHDVSGEIPRAPCKESCEQMKKPPCAKDSSSTSPDSPKPAPSPCPPTPPPCPPPPRPPSPCPPCTPPPPPSPCQRTPPSPPPCRQPISSEPPCRNPNCPHTSPHRKIPSCRTPPNNPSSSPSNRRSPARQANAKSPRSPSSSNPCPHIRIVTCPSPPKPSRKKPMCIGSLPNDCLPLPQCPSSLCRAMPCQTSPPRLQNRSSANHYEKLSDSCSYNCIQSSPEAPFFYSPIHPCPIEPEKCEKPVIPCKSSPCNTHRPDYTPSVECGSSVPPVYKGPRACDECQSSDVNVFPWPTKNQVSNQSSMASLYNASTQPDKIVYGKCKKDCPMLPKLSCETIPSPKKECPSSCPNKQGSPRPPCMPKIQCPQPRPPPKPKPPPPAEPICRPSKCKSKSKLSGLFLKMNPIKNKKSMCSKDCLAWKTNYKGEDGCISLNSEERITIRLKKDSPCTQEATEGYNIKVQDEDGITLFERKDYRLQRAGCSIKRPSLLDDMYRASEVRRVTTNDSVNPIRNKDKECFKEILEVKSDASIANLIEIQFKLKVTQGDNTTEVNIGNDEFKDNETKENIQETLNQAAQEVYMVKNESEEVVDNCDQKNDINIRIVIKNFKSKTGNKKINLKHDSYSKNFAEKISAKFHTVSTGYSDVLHDDKVFSIHRATVDLTSSVENTKTQSIKSEECISESMLTAEGILADYSEPSICRCIAADLSNGGKGEDIESKSFASQKFNGSKENHLINQDKLTNRMSEYNKDSNTKKPSKNRTQETDTDKPIELEYELETDTEKRAEIAETKQLSSIEVIVKPYTKDEKKELLKQIFEKANDNKPKTKGRMKKLREMLKVILTSDSSEADDPNLTSTEIPNNEIFASLKPNDFKDNGSMNTFYTEESNRLLLGIDTKAIHPTAENNSECSNSNSEVSVSSDTEAPKVSACMCSTVAARLKMASRFGEGGCCCTKQIDQRNEEITCDIKPDSDFHYLKHELNDVEIQRSTYLSSKVNSTKLSVHRKNIRPSETDSIVLKDESGLIGEKSWSQTNIIRQCEMKKVKQGDKNVLMSNHTSKFTDNRNKKEFIDPPVKINASDILQSYEVKKAVLEIYTEKTICDDGEHLVAKLPKFVYDRRK